MVGLSQLVNTVGRATATAQGIPSIPFARIVDQKAALDYIADDDPFWAEAVLALVPEILVGLTKTPD